MSGAQFISRPTPPIVSYAPTAPLQGGHGGVSHPPMGQGFEPQRLPAPGPICRTAGPGPLGPSVPQQSAGPPAVGFAQVYKPSMGDGTAAVRPSPGPQGPFQQQQHQSVNSQMNGLNLHEPPQPGGSIPPYCAPPQQGATMPPYSGAPQQGGTMGPMPPYSGAPQQVGPIGMAPNSYVPSTHSCGPMGNTQGMRPESFSMPPRPPSMQSGPSSMQTGPNMQPGPPSMQPTPPNMQSGPPSLQPGPPSMQPGPPSMQPGPNIQSGPPSMQPRPPSLQSGPPSMQTRPPSMQPVPSSMQHGPPSMQPAPPTQPMVGGSLPFGAKIPPPTGPQIGNIGPPMGGAFPPMGGSAPPGPPMGEFGAVTGRSRLPMRMQRPNDVSHSGPQTTMNFASDSLMSSVPGGVLGYPGAPQGSGGYSTEGGAYNSGGGGSYPAGGGVYPPGGYQGGGGHPPARPMAPGGGAGPMLGYQPAQPAHRLDPDQTPSAVQVMEEDRRTRSGPFPTGVVGTVPPLVTTDFITEDQGLCSPRFIRSTMYSVPCTAELLKQTHVPFVTTIVPFPQLHPDEVSPPLVDLGGLGPVRCNRCKAYVCPAMVFIDGGRKFQCAFCGCHTEVPTEYFAHLDHTGRRVDCNARPELCLGAYEFIATPDYCKDNKLPNAPAYIFMIDVSYSSVKSGLVALLCARLKHDVLRHLPREEGREESEIRVGFVTYGRELHFYNIKGSLAQPQMLVVSDVEDVFVPLLDGFFVTLGESEALIDSLLLQISTVFADTRQTESLLGPVIQAGLDALRSAERAGKLIIFHSALPTADAPGKLTNRDDRQLLGTDKEKTLLLASGSFYTQLGGECVVAGCAVDLYLFPSAYVDVATLAEVPRLTGGSLHKYNYFQSDLDGDRFISDLRTNVSQSVAFDAVLRVRTSTGIRAVDFLGNFFMANTTDVELAIVDVNKAITVEIRHDDKLSDAEAAYLQVAVLYTSASGQRRLRVLNSAYSCCTQAADLFRNCELDTLINYWAKLAIRECVNSGAKQMRDTLTSECAQILACYRKHCASPSSVGQLILPECMKLLPAYTNCVVGSPLLQTVDISTDERSYAMHRVNSMEVSASAVYFYPRLLPLHDLDVSATDLPTSLRCSYERLRDNGVYLLENGMTMYLWVGLGVALDWVRGVFNVQSTAHIDIDKSMLAEFDNALSRRVVQIVRRVCAERHRNMKLIIVRQRDKLEPLFLQQLVEDRGAGGSSSYVDFLCHVHKEIRNILD